MTNEKDKRYNPTETNLNRKQDFDNENTRDRDQMNNETQQPNDGTDSFPNTTPSPSHPGSTQFPETTDETMKTNPETGSSHDSDEMNKEDEEK
jgi:hypothetical protein